MIVPDYPGIEYFLPSQRPRVTALDGRPLIVHVVLNVELWAFNQPMPRAILPSPQGRSDVPDVCNFGWVDYGMRTGLPRLMAMLTSRNIPVTVSMNANVIDHYAPAALAMRDAGWEFVGHGLSQKSLLADEDAAGTIKRTLDKIERFSGKRPRGWLGPGLQESPATPGQLLDEGVEFVLDWAIDDLPLWMQVGPRWLLVVPYTLELNDSVLWAAHEYPSEEMYRRAVTTLDVFEPEMADQPRILTLALHPHLVGVPHRLPYLAKLLDLLRDRSDATFLTGSSIADWYASEHRPGLMLSTPAAGGAA